MKRGRKKRKSLGLRIAGVLMILAIALLAVLAVIMATNKGSSGTNGIAQFFQSFFGGKRKEVLEQEADDILSLNPYEEDIDKTVQATGTFGEIESVMKDAFSTYSTGLRDLRNLLKDDGFLQLLTLENLQSDGPDMKASLDLLDSLQEKVTSTVEKLKSMKSESYMMDLVKPLGLNEYFTDIYRETVVNKMMPRFMYSDQELDDAQQTLLSSIESRKAAMEFLRDSGGKWEITDGKIAFQDGELLEKYNSLIADIK